MCTVPLSTSESAAKHYSSKIHGKKVERWRQNYITEMEQKRLCQEMVGGVTQESYPGPREKDFSNSPPPPSIEAEEPPMSQPLDPKMIGTKT